MARRNHHQDWRGSHHVCCSCRPTVFSAHPCAAASSICQCQRFLFNYIHIGPKQGAFCMRWWQDSSFQTLIYLPTSVFIFLLMPELTNTHPSLFLSNTIDPSFTQLCLQEQDVVSCVQINFLATLQKL